MTKPRLTGVEAALFALAALAWASRAAPHPLLINESRSLPRGLYLLRPDRTAVRGAVVALRPPPEAISYLAALGAPEDLRLLKRVAALGGDPVCREGGEVQVPGRRVEARALDGRGRALPAWRGCERLRPDQVFVLGETADGFDSRYFGPVADGDLEGVYEEILRW